MIQKLNLSNKSTKEQYVDIKVLKKLTEEGVNALISIKGAQDVLDSINETAEERLGIKKVEFKRLVAAKYEMTYNPEVYIAKKLKIEELYDNLEVLNN